MDLIADGLLIAGALSAAFYCFVLSRRVRRLANLDDGLGAAIAQLSRQVDDMRKALQATQATSEGALAALSARISDAEALAGRLEELGEEYAPRRPTKAKQKKPAAKPKPNVDVARASKPTGQARAASTAVKPDIAARLASLVPPKAEKAAPQPMQAEKQLAQDVAADTKRTAAKQLQEDIRKRVRGGPDKAEKDNFVKALQSVLASAGR